MSANYNVLNLETFELSSPTTPSTDMSQSLISQPYDVGNSPNGYAMRFAWTGSPVGIVSIMGSLDGVHYTIPIFPQTTGPDGSTGGEDGELTYDLFGTSIGSIQGVYTSTSGSGTLTIQVSKKA